MKNSKSEGMTLLEVMVALVIFAIAAISITKSIGELIANMPILEERTYAQWVADNVLVDAKLDPTFPAAGKKEGRVEMAGKEWYWRKEAVKTTDDDFRLLRVSVSLDERYSNIIAQVNTYVLKTK
ncbi:type II secretion system protein GspI [Parashewanella spongiae]|uniref:Type II secretion system protein I n=1 Tax=Parashewanella spongiae TaxID=342950 RepID=A0A3A6U420_9GAMM|nr:type II secretion system minor pseudopilin GspI [Parashewanella spongiae]MCL1077151.1 type II secretion system minor pseudopilin GspI [Parashewanella spongiae]RJY18826.1 type II secretion system protein GspI [Parashewanella spongiae]